MTALFVRNVSAPGPSIPSHTSEIFERAFSTLATEGDFGDEHNYILVYGECIKSKILSATLIAVLHVLLITYL